MSGVSDPAEAELAARLAARLCHDFVGPAGAVVSGLDILAGSPAGETGDAARELIDSGARRLLALIVFSRAAYGWDDQEFRADALEALARGLFRDQRPTLDWAVEAVSLRGAAARALLILVQIAADAVAVGGRARAWAKAGAGGVYLGVDATGPKARLHPEVADGLGEAPRAAGVSGRWIQARFLHAMVAAAGGAVATEVRKTEIRFSVRLP